MTLQPLPSEFLYPRGKFSFLFYQCGTISLRLNHRRLNRILRSRCRPLAWDSVDNKSRKRIPEQHSHPLNIGQSQPILITSKRMDPTYRE